MITIVSGLPRSGTSMMMKMLEAGGLPPLKDDWRKADDDNPGGYYEYERVKGIREDSSWLDGAEGKAVKMVSRLLVYLPPARNCRIVFMRRDTDEMLRSQRKMLERSGQPTDDIPDETMKNLFEKHLAEIEAWVKERESIRCRTIWYDEVIHDPLQVAKTLADFLALPLDVDSMAATVDPSLYRNRGV